MKPHSAVRRRHLSCGPISTAYMVTSKPKIAAPTPANTSALQEIKEEKRKKKEYLFSMRTLLHFGLHLIG